MYVTVKASELTDVKSPKRSQQSYLQGKGDRRWAQRVDSIVDRVIIIDMQLREQSFLDYLTGAHNETR